MGGPLKVYIRDNGKENGNYRGLWWLYWVYVRDNGTENGNYRGLCGLYRDYIKVMRYILGLYKG